MADLFHQDEPEAPPGVYVEVAVERGLERGGQAAGGTLTYRAETELEVGQGVQVPLGRGNKPTQGVVVRAGGAELVRGMPASKVKTILKVTGTKLPPRLVELAQWMAGYYICPLGMVLATMVPAAVKRGVGLRKKTYLTKVARRSEPGALSDGSEQ
jgi:primosomal protein N' (replication factor Y)